jgi:hypothetical protein
MGKRGGGADDLYGRHLRGTPYASNPANNRLGLMQRMYMRILTELAVNRFEWKGLPKEVDPRFLEMTLFNFALSVFFKDTPDTRTNNMPGEATDKFFALQGGANGPINMMQNPTAFRVVGNNFVGRTLKAGTQCVPIWANYVRVPDTDIVTIYAQKLAEFDRTVEINGKNMRNTKILVANENQRLSIANINRQIDEGQSYVSVHGALGDLEFIKALDLGVHPDSVINAHIARTRIWNECMGLLGIENANQDKKERLVSSEVDANNDQTSMMRNVNLNARKQACDIINDVYGLNISVEFRSTAVTGGAEDADTETDAIAPEGGAE